MEDNPVNRKLMMAMLDRLGVEARFANTGEEAVEFARLQAFSLVFMDISLPGIDGIETMRRIRPLSGANSPKPRFIALTAHAMRGDTERFVAEGMDEVLTKPVDFEKLSSIIESSRHAEATPAPGPTAEPIAPLPSSASIDEKRGLMLLGGDRRLYSEMLDLFGETYAGFSHQLLAVLGNGNFTEGRRLVHGLKSSGATLGLLEIEELAADIEARLVAGEKLGPDDPSLAALAEAMREAMEWILKKTGGQTREHD